MSPLSQLFEALHFYLNDSACKYNKYYSKFRNIINHFFPESIIFLNPRNISHLFSRLTINDGDSTSRFRWRGRALGAIRLMAVRLDRLLTILARLGFLGSLYRSCSGFRHINSPIFNPFLTNNSKSKYRYFSKKKNTAASMKYKN